MDTTQILLVVFIGLVAVSMLVQAICVVGMALGARAAQKKVMSLLDDVRLHALPIIMSSREVITDLTPKIKTISGNVEAITTTARNKTEQVGGLVSDVTNRAGAQSARVDGILKGTLDQLTHAAHAVEAGIYAPVRQVNGILNGLRAGVEVLRKKPELDPEDDMFV